MSDCSNHKKEIAGLNMEQLANAVKDLHYEALEQFFYYLSKGVEIDGEKDYADGKEKTAAALQYLSMSIFECALRAEGLWKTVKPFMK